MNLNLLAFYTDQLLVLSLLIVLFAALTKKITPTQSFFVVFTTTISWSLGSFIKSNFWLPRPYLTSGQPPRIDYLLDGSFPSNHALVAFLLCFCVILFNRKLGYLLMFIAFMVSVGRIAAGVHSAIDVFGSFFIGLFLVFLSKKFVYPKLLG